MSNASSLTYSQGEVATACARLGFEADSDLDYRDAPLLHYCLTISDLEALDAYSDEDWGALNARSDIPREVWARPIGLGFANHRNATRWHEATLSIGALAYLCSLRADGVPKDFRGIVLSRFKTPRRVTGTGNDSEKDGIVSLNGVSLDDDGVNARVDVVPSYLVISFSTASDGKAEDLVKVDTYRKYAKGAGLPLIPTGESMSRFLNQLCKHGDAYKGVTVQRHASHPDKPAIKNVDGVLHFVAHFAPQERTRYLVPFERPVDGELLKRLLKVPNGVKRLVEQIEYEALGVRGTDPSCFEAARIGFLPSGNKPNFVSAVIGPAKLFDPVPLAEKIVAEAPVAVKPRYHVTKCKAVPPDLAGDLRGVRLASLIADAYPELVYLENGLSPLKLKECPFCDEHGSMRHKADNSLYCYDPDQSPYPTMRCRHQTCVERTTEEFVDALIDCGMLDAASVFNNPDYRDIYDEEAAPPPSAVILNWRKFLK